jgi:16S rRNA (adenine(1408)-N(1))-methyltransferase
VRRTARLNPDHLVLGLDAVADNLHEASRLAARKPARGGVANALFGRLALEQAPGELAGLADVLTVFLPWGSLLRAVALPEPEGLQRLGALCKPGASVRILFGYEPFSDRAAVQTLGLPSLVDPTLPARLQARYRDLGFALRVRSRRADEIRTLPTTWAQKLALASRRRLFLDLDGKFASAPDFSR